MVTEFKNGSTCIRASCDSKIEEKNCYVIMYEGRFNAKDCRSLLKLDGNQYDLISVNEDGALSLGTFEATTPKEYFFIKTDLIDERWEAVLKLPYVISVNGY